MRERCLEHGLATGPDGACVLCRSRKRPTRAPQLALAIVVLGAIAVGLVLWKLARPAMDRAPSRLEPANAASGPAFITAVSPAVRSTETVRSEVTTDRTEQPVFSERDPRGLPSELRARGETDVVGEYLPGKESYELFLPAACLAGEPHGILVWIGSGPSGALPNSEWRRVLAAHRLIWAGPNRVGNEREIALRISLALDSVQAVSRRFALDRGRVYVGGLSGGAKSAFRALLFYPEVFHGALLAAGVEYYRAVPARAHAQGATWPQRMGIPRDLALAKTRAVALTTGPNDFNYGQISDVVAGMHEDGFARVQIFSWQDLGHAPPPPDALDRALTWLDSPR